MYYIHLGNEQYLCYNNVKLIFSKDVACLLAQDLQAEAVNINDFSYQI